MVESFHIKNIEGGGDRITNIGCIVCLQIVKLAPEDCRRVLGTHLRFYFIDPSYKETEKTIINNKLIYDDYCNSNYALWKH